MRSQLIHAAMVFSVCTAGGYSYYHFNPEQATAIAKSICIGEWPQLTPAAAPAPVPGVASAPAAGAPSAIAAAPVAAATPVAATPVTPPRWRDQSSLYSGERLVGMGAGGAAAADSPAARASRALFTKSADSRSSRAATSRSSNSSRKSTTSAGTGGYGRYSINRQEQRGTYSKSARYRSNSFSSSLSKQHFKKPTFPFTFTNRSATRYRR
jgi:hypothetical protein